MEMAVESCMDGRYARQEDDQAVQHMDRYVSQRSKDRDVARHCLDVRDGLEGRDAGHDRTGVQQEGQNAAQ